MAMAMFGGVCSCSDFFETESTHYIDADKDHLASANDTIYSVIGILNKVQAIADRTVLLGELRGDLVDVTDATPADLRQIAMFEVDDDNEYNCPRDYYAIINNCNYFIAKADTAMKNNRNENIFLKEYAAVKAIRAWTYLQLVTTYGLVPFVTEPVLTEEEAAAEYPMYDIKQVCNYFINEDNLQSLVEVPTPGYGEIKRLNSKLFYFPVNIVLGDLNLWAGNYWEAAKCYHDYLVKRNGESGYYATGVARSYWYGEEYMTRRNLVSSWISQIMSESYYDQGELITVIPGDSIPAEGYYSQLGSIFNSSEDDGYKARIVPSQSLIDLSASQVYCCYDDQKGITYAPPVIEDYGSGDLRLRSSWRQLDAVYNSNRILYNRIAKYNVAPSYCNIHIYRRSQIYLRMAEAINRAGYPHYAFAVLSSGVNTDVLTNTVCPNYSESDSLKLLSQMDFTSDKYILYDPSSTSDTRQNTLGIHTHGSGYTPFNEYYQMPYNEAITDQAAQIAWQIEQVEQMIVDEMALECAFEGTRFYDLVRVAMHSGNTSYVSNMVHQRRGSGKDAGITTDLLDQKNWFLRWNNQIGY